MEMYEFLNAKIKSATNNDVTYIIGDRIYRDTSLEAEAIIGAIEPYYASDGNIIGFTLMADNKPIGMLLNVTAISFY
jgi:hypothetical protein